MQTCLGLARVQDFSSSVRLPGSLLMAPCPQPTLSSLLKPRWVLGPLAPMLPATERMVLCDPPCTPSLLKCGWGLCSCPVCYVTPRRKVPGGRRPSAGRLFPQLAKVRSGGFPALSTGLTLVLGAPLLSHAAQAGEMTETPELGPVLARWRGDSRVS